MLLVFETGKWVTTVFRNFGMEKERSQNCANVNATIRAKLHDFKTLFSMLSLRETVNILLVFETVNFGRKTVQKIVAKTRKNV
jgi:ABC-type phosphate/phosphonate transport system ATPase subunit